MEQDERGTLERLRTHRIELIRTCRIAKNRGAYHPEPPVTARSWSSRAWSMRCVVMPRYRRGCGSANADDTGGSAHSVPHRRQFGDIIFDEGDIYGDGVNVAARLELARRSRRQLRHSGCTTTRSATVWVSLQRISGRKSFNNMCASSTLGARYRCWWSRTKWVGRPAASAHQANDRRLALRQYERRSRTGVLRRWADRKTSSRSCHAGPSSSMSFHVTRPLS